jgi:PAS domain S-box-containing protein
MPNSYSDSSTDALRSISEVPIPTANLLVIDDQPENLNLLSAILVERGYKVRSVTKGSTGIRGAQAAPPDLILLDVNMPQINGYQVCQHLKSDDRTRNIPIIFISALEDVLDKVRAFQAGGIDYITKPFQVEEVLARIEAHLTIGNLQKQLQVQNIQLRQEMTRRELVEERFTKAFRVSPAPIAIATLDSVRFIDVNPSFLKMTGYTLEEVIGHTVYELNLQGEGDSLAQLLARVLENNSLHNQEFEFENKAGESIVVLLSVETIQWAGVEAAIFIANDITERKRLENEFISLVSHELRTPLTSIMGALHLLAASYAETLTPQGQKVFQIATNNTERLIRLVNDILDLERMKSGRISMQKTKCNIADLITQAVEAIQPLANQSEINLSRQSIDLEIWVDADRLLQTLTNLLSNAIKFSDSNSTIWITASLTAPPPAVPNPQLLLTIRDQGRGIPEDQLQLIFEPFQQVDASDSRQRGGSGLGLAICRNIVEQHGGKIWAESRLGQGSTFYILLAIEN